MTLRARRLMLCGLAALAATVGLSVPAAGAQAYCPPVQVFESRGSGDPGFSEPDAAFIQALRNDLPSGVLAAESNPYPAVSIIPTVDKGLKALADRSPREALTEVADALNGLGAATRLSGLGLGAYHDSVVKGRQELTRMIVDFHKRCATSSVVLVGYSQGAQVTGDVISKLDSTQRAAIAGVVLFGDPRYNNRSFADVERRPRIGILGRRGEYPDQLRDRVRSYCHSLDPICQLGKATLTPRRKLDAEHVDYDRRGEPQNAAAYFTRRLNRADPLASRIAVGANGSSYQVGPWHTGNPYRPRPKGVTLADVDAAFGSNDRCSVAGGFATTSWPAVALTARFLTLGAIFDRRRRTVPFARACSFKSQIQVDSLTASSPRWSTDRGLRVGDSEQRITQLYPDATVHDDGLEDAGWWLVTVSRFGAPAGALQALTANGTITALTVKPLAEGD